MQQTKFSCCQCCSQVMEPKQHFPVTLLCKHQMCLACVTVKCNKNNQVVCLSCNKTGVVDLKKEKLNQQIMLVDMARVQYKCFKHQDKEIEFYCGTDQSFLCNLCHTYQNTESDRCTKTEITEQFTLLKDRLGVMIKNAKLKLIQVNRVLERKPPMDSKELKKSFQECADILTQPHIKEGDADYERVTKYQKKVDPLKVDSSILKNAISIKSLQSYLGNQRIRENLYRGSRDGFEASTFHAKCDQKGRSLMVLKTTRGSVFGGYTDISWRSNGEKTQGNKNSFLFLLGADHTASIGKCKDPSIEVYHSASVGPNFGYQEIEISFYCNQNESSQASLGNRYEKINGLEYLDQGKQYFKVAEIEVFTVQ